MKSVFALLCVAMAASACTPHMQEQWDYAWYKQKKNWYARDRGQDFKDLFGVSALYDSHERQEEQADQRVCFHPNSQRRVVMQDGVADRMDYTWCVLQPYENDEGLGQRLDGRPAPRG